MVTDLPQNHGWDNEFNYTWTEEVYPEDVACFLANTSSIRSNIVESSVEGNDDEKSVNNNIETSVENNDDETWVEENEDQSRGEFDEDPGSVEEVFEVEGQDEIDYQW